MKENNKGITLIALVITIVVLLIVSAIAIEGGLEGVKESREEILLSELGTVQHAVIERYTKYKLTKNSELLIGTAIEVDDLDNIDGGWKLTNEEIGTDIEKQYKNLNSNDLKQLGLKAENNKEDEDEYIVNYYTGEVYNVTVKRTKTGVLLYKSIQ
ncbi:MAG: hypothetical protein IKF38_02250 [Clostridia bacterium]|nr:hypothetical protein [Clostridia bacterium]